MFSMSLSPMPMHTTNTYALSENMPPIKFVQKHQGVELQVATCKMTAMQACQRIGNNSLHMN
jgi:hypothetical protein